LRLTADDVLDVPVPDHLRGYELEDGALVEVSRPSARHARVVAELTYHLVRFVRDRGLAGRVYAGGGCVLDLPSDRERLRGPDVAYVTGEALQASGGEPDRGWLRLVPDLVVEVDSPGRRPTIEQRRIQKYLDAGVRLLWVVHTEARTATVYHPDGSARLLRTRDALDGEHVLPGLRLPLGDVFPEGEPGS
jgi:Uma2 family endonuclease